MSMLYDTLNSWLLLMNINVIDMWLDNSGILCSLYYTRLRLHWTRFWSNLNTDVSYILLAYQINLHGYGNNIATNVCTASTVKNTSYTSWSCSRNILPFMTTRNLDYTNVYAWVYGLFSSLLPLYSQCNHHITLNYGWSCINTWSHLWRG